MFAGSTCDSDVINGVVSFASVYEPQHASDSAIFQHATPLQVPRDHQNVPGHHKHIPVTVGIKEQKKQQSRCQIFLGVKLLWEERRRIQPSPNLNKATTNSVTPSVSHLTEQKHPYLSVLPAFDRSHPLRKCI